MTYDIETAVAGAQSARAYMKSRNIGGGLANALMVDRALARGLAVDSDSRRRVRLSDGRRAGWFDGGRSNLNSLLARRCTRYKEVTSSLLRASNVAAPQNAVFAREEVERAWHWSQSILPAVLKPSHSMNGKLVYVAITDRAEFFHAFDTIAAEHDQVLVEEFVHGIEHRVLTVDYQVVAAVRRVPAHVVGDGTSSIGQLVEAKTAARLAAGNPVHRQLKLDPMAMRELARQGVALDRVPRMGQTIFLRSTSNIHTGGDALDVTDELSDEEVAFVQRAGRVFKGLRVAGFDVLLPRDGQGTEPCILEINYNPAIAMHHFPAEGPPRDVAGIIIDAMFPNTAHGLD